MHSRLCCSTPATTRRGHARGGMPLLAVATAMLLSAGLSGCWGEQDVGATTASGAPAPTGSSDFAGRIGRTIDDSEPAFLARPQAAQGAPNIVLILVDDLGYADISPYGGEIDTPALQSLADSGLVYSDFTVTGVCSPTRASLLTGLNHHAAGVGWLGEWDMGFPGYRGEMHPDAATLPEILREHGFATMMVGKWHLTRSNNRSVIGPFDSWPTQRGFDRFWGFLDGEASQFKPHALIEGNHVYQLPEGSDFYFPDAMTDRAIDMIRDLRALRPEQPFLLYYSTGAPHAPHHTLAEDREKYRARYNTGYDAIRTQRLARQIELGLLPEGTSLAPMNPEVQPWDALTPEQQRMYARLQENYAAFVDNMDRNIGRLRDYIAGIGELDNTIFVFLSDNGASREMGVEGSANVLAYFHGRDLSTRENLRYYDVIGDAGTHPHYPQGWMHASNTPFAHAKRTSWAGGLRVPFIISWPERIPPGQGPRHQFHHVNDVVPTLLDLLGIEPPQQVGGRPVRPLQGVSMVYSFDDAAAATRKTHQYYEVEAQRAYRRGDWKILSYRADHEPYDAHPWRLFNLADDPGETNDLAQHHPELVAELEAAWWRDAERYEVLPIIDTPLLQRAFRFRPQGAERREWRIERGTSPILVGNAPTTAGRSYVMTAGIERSSTREEGVIVAHGDAHSGYALYIQDNHLVYELNVGHSRQRVVSSTPVPAGAVRVGYRFDRGAARPGGEDEPASPIQAAMQGMGTLLIDGKPSGTLWVSQPVTAIWEGLEVGRDGQSTVSPRYSAPFEFQGKLEAVHFHFE